MRVLAVHPGVSFSVADVHRGWVRALKALGVQVVDFNLDDRIAFYSSAGRMGDDGHFLRLVSDDGAVRVASKGLEAACYEFQPDVLLVTSCFFIPLDVLDLVRARGTKVVLLHTEEPYEHDRQFARGEHADLNLINDPTHLERWRTLGPAEYIPHAYDPQVHFPRRPHPDHVSDFCFVGTGYPARVKFFEQVDWTGIDVALGGNWQYTHPDSPLRKFIAHDVDECLDNDQTALLYSGTKVGANLFRLEAERPELVDGWSIGPRTVEMAACGTFQLSEPRPELRELLGMVPTFTTVEEFSDLLRYYLAHDAEREAIAEASRARIAPRTFEANARRLLTLLERG